MSNNMPHKGTLKELSKLVGIKPATIRYRLRNGWSLEDAVNIQPTKGGSKAKTIYEIDGKIFKDRFGNEYIVNGIGYRDKHGVIHYNVKFLKSGYETTAMSSQIRGNKGRHVQDRLSPSIFGIGILGFAYRKDNPKLFETWRAMIARCYNPKNTSYKTYGALGITVCERWRRFDYFLEDAVQLPGYNKELIEAGGLVLDKDTINREAKIYSPETCCFITRAQNARESALRRWNESKV